MNNVINKNNEIYIICLLLIAYYAYIWVVAISLFVYNIITNIRA